MDIRIKYRIQKIFLFVSIVFLSLLFTPLVSAHSTVSPSQTIPSKYETFSLSVPTEKDIPTTGIRLVIPENLDRVTPLVKPGWTIQIKKEGEKVTEIEWVGGEIPAGQKDIFQFTARTPEKEGSLLWKAYQTYQNGEVVAWDRNPEEEKRENEQTYPYSVTEVVLDASAQTVEEKNDLQQNTFSSTNQASFYMSLAALVLSLLSFSVIIRRSK